MIVSINQPAYLPWLGYFERIALSDTHVVLDHVQFEKNSVTNRNKIRTPDGWQWLTVPVRTGGRFGAAIDALEIDGTAWAGKHWKSLQMNYARAPYFAEHRSFFSALLQRPWTRLDDLLRPATDYLLDAFGIRTTIVRSSTLAVPGRKDELVLDICRALGATTYLSGPLGRRYLREPLFTAAGISVRYHDYEHPVYPQAYPGFQSHLSAVDLLMNSGPASLAVLSTTAPLGRTDDV